jgi:NAD(P)-dependent dehydrogenase (short-subunit alcohol dehydrogenase family)
MRRIEGRKVIVTGGASGFGRAMARAFARRGCRIGIVDINTDGAKETLRLVESDGGSGEVYELDVRKLPDWEIMADHFFKSWGGVDILINNAGVVSVGEVGEIPIEDWEWIFSINFWGMLYGCHTFIPHMKTNGGGHIVNVASANGLMCLLEMAPYNTTKAAVIALSETLRAELSPFKIGVTAACPMFFNTNLHNDMRYTDKFWFDATHIAFDRARMTADEVAESVVKAVRKGKLYVVPQTTGKAFWAIKRLNPGLFHGSLAFLNKVKIGRPVFVWLAKRGLMQ